MNMQGLPKDNAGLKRNFLTLSHPSEVRAGKEKIRVILLLKGSTFNIYTHKHYACYFTNENRIDTTVPDISGA